MSADIPTSIPTLSKSDWITTVNLSAKTEYACIAVLDLALHHEQGDPVRIRSIADNHGIPSRFLVQILLQLKAAGIVSSIRGASGGYRLAKDPQDISLAEVMTAIDGRGAGSQLSLIHI